MAMGLDDWRSFRPGKVDREKCGRCGEICGKQIGNWAGIYYDQFGFKRLCCQCWILLGGPECYRKLKERLAKEG